jgi:general secretion pathway protein L
MKTVVFLGETPIAGEGASGSRNDASLHGHHEAFTAIAPADKVTLFRAYLPDLAPAQARAAARLLAADRSAAAIETQHVAVGDADDEGMRWIALVDISLMAQWVAGDPDAIVPAPLLFDAPVQGFVIADVGCERVLRGADVATRDDPMLTPMLTAGMAVLSLDEEAIETAVRAAVNLPPFNLRQGAFARKTSWQVDRRALKRLGVLAGVLALFTLAVPVTHILRLNRESAAMDERALALEQDELRGESASARLVALRGPGAGFAATLRTVNAAVQATPTAELTTAVFETDGTLSINAHASAPAELELLRHRIEASGFVVTAGAATGGSMPSLSMGVRGR